MRPISVILVSAVALATQTAFAADTQKVATLISKTGGDADLFGFDYAPPTSPAMKLLGLDADASPPSTSLKAFVVSASNLASAGGQSAALDIAPAALFGGINNFDDYIDKGLGYRLLRRSRIGIAAMNGDADSAKASGVALGYSISLLDSSDPLTVGMSRSADSALRQCLVAPLEAKQQALGSAMAYDIAVKKDPAVAVAAKNALDANIALADSGGKDFETKLMGYKRAYKMMTGKEPILPPDISGASLDQLRQELAEAIAKSATFDSTKPMAEFDKRADILELNKVIAGCAKMASFHASYGTDLDVGIGTFWRGRPGAIDQLKNGGGAVWAALHVPIRVETVDNVVKAAWLFGASGRYGWRETVATLDKAVPQFRADTLSAAAGIERRSDTLLLAIQYGYQQFRANDINSRPYNRSGDAYLIRGQVRMGNSSPLWLGLTYGNAEGTTTSLDAKRLLVTLSFSPPSPYNITNRP